MTEPDIPGDNQELSERSRRILNTNVSEDTNQLDLGEPESVEAKPSEINPEAISASHCPR